MKRNKSGPLGLPVEKMRGKSVKEWLKKKTRAKAMDLMNLLGIFNTVFFFLSSWENTWFSFVYASVCRPALDI